MVENRIPLQFLGFCLVFERKEQVEAAKRPSDPWFGSFCLYLGPWSIGPGGVSRLARREAPTQGPPPGARGARRRSRLVPLVYTYMREVMSVCRAVLGEPTVGSRRGLREATRGPGAPVFKLVWFFSGRPWVSDVGTELRRGPWRARPGSEAGSEGPKRRVWAGATRPYPGVSPSGRRSPPWTAKRVSDVSAAGGRA